MTTLPKFCQHFACKNGPLSIVNSVVMYKAQLTITITIDLQRKQSHYKNVGKF